MHRLRHAGVHHSAVTPPPIPDTTVTPNAVQLSAAAYYNKVYNGAPPLKINTSRCSIAQTMPARRGQLLPCADRWQVLHPAHLLRGQRLRLYMVSPAAVSILPTPGGLRSGTGQQLGRTGSTWHPPPGGAVQQRAARNH